jgi:hypothetical protein
MTDPGRIGRLCAVGTAGGGSPGVTTTAIALAQRVAGVMVDADADGGVVGLRYGGWLAPGAPSLASLLAAISQHRDAAVERHLQVLPSGVDVLVGPPSAEAATGVADQLAHSMTAVRLAAGGRHVVLDVGRIRPGSAAEQLATAADVVLVLVRPTTESVGQLLTRLPALPWPALVVAVRGTGPYVYDDVRGALTERGIEVGRPVHVMELPDDPHAVASLAGRASRRRRTPPLTEAMDRLRELLDTASQHGLSTAGQAIGVAR